MFVCGRKQAEALSQCQALYVDGTFKTAPKPFKQIVTFNGLYKDHVVPLVFALATGKEVGHYRQILQASKQVDHFVVGLQLKTNSVFACKAPGGNSFCKVLFFVDCRLSTDDCDSGLGSPFPLRRLCVILR